MPRQLSHSQVNTYLTCGKKYDYHYNHRLREKVTSGALVFGSALDQTVNTILLDKQKNAIRSVTFYQTEFRKNWLQQKINNNLVELPESTLVAYSKYDYDSDLLTEGDIAAIYDRAATLLTNVQLDPKNKRDSILAAYDKYAAVKNYVGVENTYENVAKFINLCNWHVMLRKGELMTSLFVTEVLPLIKNVVSVQEKVEIKNDNGDSVIGFIDSIVIFEGEDFPRITDLKTSSIKYDDDSANKAPQLASYSHVKQIPNTAFIVFSKTIKKNKSKTCAVCGCNGTGSRAKTCDAISAMGGKRCHGAWIETIQPEATFEIFKGSINSVFEQNVMDNYEQTLKGVEAGVYLHNFNNCEAFGRKCQFYSLCHQGEAKELIKV